MLNGGTAYFSFLGVDLPFPVCDLLPLLRNVLEVFAIFLKVSIKEIKNISDYYKQSFQGCDQMSIVLNARYLDKELRYTIYDLTSVIRNTQEKISINSAIKVFVGDCTYLAIYLLDVPVRSHSNLHTMF